MNILLKSAIIVAPATSNHLKKRDVLIENGIISKIAVAIELPKNTKEIKLPNLHISEGWFDSSVSFGEPGFEERETIENGLLVAAKSGFTHVAVNANTHPVTDSKGNIQFLKSKAAQNIVSLYPIGALTMGAKGIDLAEMFDMSNAGAVAFYDYKKPIENPNLLKIALQYVQSFNGLVQSFPLEMGIATTGMVHEGINSTKLGLKPIPALAEELQITRDLYILEYTGGRLHIPTISTKKSVALIKQAKKKGLQVTCSVSVNNVVLTDSVLEDFSTSFKLMPPLRGKEDCDALIKGLKEGIIDAVTSDHEPIDIEHKKVEFDHSNYGSIGLESCFGALRIKLDTTECVTVLVGLKSIFNIPKNEIKEGSVADITLFNPEGSSIFEEKHISSSSKNAAFLNNGLTGKVYGIIANNQLSLNI